MKYEKLRILKAIANFLSQLHDVQWIDYVIRAWQLWSVQAASDMTSLPNAFQSPYLRRL